MRSCILPRLILKGHDRDFSGGPVVKTVLQRLEVRFQSLVGEQRSHMPCGVAKKSYKEDMRGASLVAQW